MYMVIYQKANGDILNRVRNTYPPYSIGEYTSMGWLVLDIKHFFKDGYYSFPEYCRLVNKEKNKPFILKLLKL